MKPTLPIALLALLALPAAADDAVDRVKKAVDALQGRDGYQMGATWTMDSDKLKEPVKGTVDSLVRQKDDFIRLQATFDEGNVTVFQRGTVIAAQNQDTKEWGAASDDAKAKFVLKMFNLKAFLAETAGMAVNARLSKGEQDAWIRVEYEVDGEKLKKLLGDAEAGKALTNGTLENATMKIALEVERTSGTPQRLTVTIEGDSKSVSTKKPVADDPNWPAWDPDDPKDPKAPKPPPPPPPPPNPGDPPAPVTQHVKVVIQGLPDYKSGLEITVPEGAKKVLGM